MYLKTGFIVIVICLLCSCSFPQMNIYSQEMMIKKMQDFREGRITLNCIDQKCIYAWDFSQRNRVAYAKANQWEKVAETIIQSDFNVDFAYLLLGDAAYNMQYYEAALIYYNKGYYMFSNSSKLNKYTTYFIVRGMNIRKLFVDNIKDTEAILSIYRSSPSFSPTYSGTPNDKINENKTETTPAYLKNDNSNKNKSTKAQKKTKSDVYRPPVKHEDTLGDYTP